MLKIKSEGRCPESYYEEIMKKDFNKWNKMQLVAFINVNSDEDNQVTLRPRKSTLVRIAKKIQLMAEAEETCKVNKDGPLDSLIKWIVLTGVFGFFTIIALEFVSFWSDIPLFHLLGVIAVGILLVGIPLRVFLWERKYNG